MSSATSVCPRCVLLCNHRQHPVPNADYHLLFHRSQTRLRQEQMSWPCREGLHTSQDILPRRNLPSNLGLFSIRGMECKSGKFTAKDAFILSLPAYWGCAWYVACSGLPT